MAEKVMHFLSSILSSLASPTLCTLINKLIEFQHCYTRIKWFLCSQIEISNQNQSPIDPKPNISSTQCNSCGKRISSRIGQTTDAHKGAVLSGEDVEMVVKSLGLGSLSEEAELQKCENCSVVCEFQNFLEEKEATVEELKEAFSVFDKNGDGFIDAGELGMVMSMLEMDEGFQVEECLEMIRAFDADGDGRINFSEFRSMLENVT